MPQHAGASCVFILVLSGLLSIPLWAGGRSLADYPLRVHVFQNSEHVHYVHTQIDVVSGEGRANLFENGEPRGFDDNFRCGDRMRTSPGFETYPARWKKKDRTLEVLLPQMGKPGAMESCELQVSMKENTYYRHSGALEEEPAAAFKERMEKHKYDPEHGKNEPVGTGKPEAQ